MSQSAEKGVCDGCQKRPCVCETVVLPTVENDALADALERHDTLGGRCTCGATLPAWRLDTPRWFAEHLASVARSVLPPGSDPQ